MLKREVCSLKNSLGPNILTDDKTALNYLALCKCITGVEHEGKIKHPSISQACSAYKLFHTYDATIDGKIGKRTLDDDEDITMKKVEIKKRYNSRLKFIVENIITGEKTECNGIGGVVDLIKIKDTYVSSYANHGRKYKGIYKIYKAENTARGTNSRAMKITNVETGETKEFESVKATAKFLGKATSTIKHHSERGSSTSGWEIEYLD
ncbi:NUMOD1 domain-containing DNA-binding protein [Romboutsia sp.]|uniref:NUMOD1 domain-containing DNA-binding protein n=1 Tax=Romboutsia sp. TaxID=1965302 RepID=UPI002CA9FB3E|nr:NUMOD1 domain-containing DNA-binding protein [Romboutsia sp.]HSQ89517.1 NUMOD1 domain-containing DNA-binding protein [Romboutsia sp.]